MKITMVEKPKVLSKLFLKIILLVQKGNGYLIFHCDNFRKSIYIIDIYLKKQLFVFKMEDSCFFLTIN